MADRIVQLKDQNDDNIYPVPPFGLPVPITTGGTGANNATDAVQNLGLKNFLKVKRFNTGSITVPASGALSKPLSDFVTIPTGYKLLGFVGVASNNTNVIPRAWRYNNNDLTYQYSLELRNLSSSAVSTSIDCWFLFIREDLYDQNEG